MSGGFEGCLHKRTRQRLAQQFRTVHGAPLQREPLDQVVSYLIDVFSVIDCCWSQVAVANEMFQKGDNKWRGQRVAAPEAGWGSGETAVTEENQAELPAWNTDKDRRVGVAQP